MEPLEEALKLINQNHTMMLENRKRQKVFAKDWKKRVNNAFDKRDIRLLFTNKPAL